MRSRARSLHLTVYPTYIRPAGAGLMVDDNGEVRAAVIKDVAGSFWVSSDDAFIAAARWLRDNFDLSRSAAEVELRSSGWRLHFA